MLRFEPAPEPEPETYSFDSAGDGAVVRTGLPAARMQEWSEARVLEWAESVALSANDVEVVKRAFVEDGGVDGDELAHMRPRSLQKLLRRTGSRDPEALADAVLQERDRATGQTPAAPHVGRRWTRPGDHAGRARQPFLELVSSPVTSHASDLDDAHEMRGAERLQRNPSYEAGSEPPISPRSSASDFSPRSDASSVGLGEQLEPRVLYCLSTENPLRQGAVWLKGAAWFERTVLVLIVANCVIISLQVPSCGDAQVSCELMGETWNASRCAGDAAAVDRAECALHGGVWHEAACGGAAAAEPEASCELQSVLAGYVRGGEDAKELQDNTELGFTIVFTLEALTKVLAVGLVSHRGAYLRNGWNLLDATVVLTSWLGLLLGSGNASVFRVFRVLRPLRTMSRIPGMTTIMATLISSVHQLKDVLLIVILIFFIFSILAVQFWTELPRLQCDSPLTLCTAEDIVDAGQIGCVCASAGINRTLEQVDGHWTRTKQMSSAANESDISSCVGEPRVEDWFYCDSQGAIRFDNFFYSVVAVFQVITLEGWTDIMYTVDDATEFSVAWMFFVAIVLFVGMFVIQLLLAVITKAYSDEAQKERETNRAVRQAQELEDLVSEVRDRLSEKNLLDDMDEAFKIFDLDSDGFIVVSEVRSSLTQLLGRSISRRTAARFVGLVDSDGDGKVSPDEFMVKIGARVEPPERGRLDTIKQSCQRSDSQQARFAGVRRVMEADAMSLLVLGLIAVNTVLLAMEYHDEELCDEMEDADGRLSGVCMDTDLQNVLSIANVALTTFFAVEMLLKLVGMGVVEYCSDSMNKFDGFIVITSVLELVLGALNASGEDEGGLMTILRAGRLLRIFRSARKWKKLREVMQTLLRTLPRVAPLSLLVFLMIVIYSLLGMMLFGGRFYFPYRDDCSPWKTCAVPRANFDDFPTAFISVFQILTGEDWNMIFYDTVAVTGMAAVLFFVIIVIVGNYIVLSLFVAILLEGFTTDDMAAEQDQKRTDAAAAALVESAGGATSQKNAKDKTKAQAKQDEAPPKGLVRFVEHSCFERVIMACILLSSVQLAYQNPFDHDGPMSKTTEAVVLWYLDVSFLAVFSAEFVLKHVAYGCGGYWRDSWNQLDGFIVFTGYIGLLSAALPQVKALRGLRALRALRPLRAMRRIQGMRVTVNALISSMPLVAPIGLVSLLFFLIFAILGVQLFAGTYARCVMPDDPSVTSYEAFEGRAEMHPSPYIQRFGDNAISAGNHSLLVSDFESYCQLEWSVHGTDCTRRECLLVGGEWATAPSNFDTVWSALQTLSEMSTTEGWPDVMWSGVDAVAVGTMPQRGASIVSAGFFILFMIVGKFFVLNLFTSALIDQFLQMQQRGEGIDMLTQGQRDWIEAQKKMLDIQATARPTVPPHPWRVKVYNLVEAPRFEWSVIGIITLNMLFLGAKHRGMEGTAFGTASQLANVIFMGLFALEACLKLVAYGREYFDSAWNTFDLVCVVASAADLLFQLGGFATFFRVIRIMRVTKMLRGMIQFRQMIETIVTSIVALFNVGLLLSLMLFVYSVLGVALFHSACTVPPPAADAFDPTRDPCGNSSRLGFSGFFALNVTQAEAAWSESELTGEEPAGGWSTVCTAGTLQCGDFHEVWQCENSDWLEEGHEPICAGDGDALGRQYHPCLCEEVDTHANFASFGVALLTLVRFSTGEYWNGLLRDVESQDNPAALLYFGSFMVLSTLVVLNLLVATIVSNHEQAVDKAKDEVASKKNMEEFQDAWEAIERTNSGGQPKTPGWIRRQDLRGLVDALSPRLGFQEDDDEEDREKKLQLVRQDLPDHNGMIQLNETLASLAGRSMQERIGRSTHEMTANLPIELQRELKRKKLVVVNRGRDPADIGKAQLQEVFDILDEDGSGSLDQGEIAEALKILDLKISLKTAMQVMDSDSSGEVSFSEFSSWWFKHHGIDKIPEVKYSMGSPRPTDDGDGDGVARP